MGKSMIPQHEPLRVPTGWNSESRAFVIQLERILDDIYSHFRKVGTKDLDSELLGMINDTYEYEDIGSFATEDAVKTEFSSIIQDMKNNSVKFVKIRGSATDGFLKEDYADLCQIHKGASSTYARVIMYELGTHDIISGRKKPTGWDFKKVILEE